MILFAAGGLFLVASVSLLLWRALPPHWPADRIRIESPGIINAIEKVRLGGLDQWIQIRGHDLSKPILLFLHGGPGFPQPPLAHRYAEIEREYDVVQWSNVFSRSVPLESMCVAVVAGRKPRGKDFSRDDGSYTV